MQHPIVLALFTLASLPNAQEIKPDAGSQGTEQTSPAREAPGRQAQTGKNDEEARAGILLHDLDETIVKTTGAHERARRVAAILAQIKAILEAGETTDKAAVGASEELVASLKNGIDQLYQDARLISDGVRFDVLPGYRATQSKMEARMRNLEPSSPKREELQALYDKAAENVEMISSSLERLERNIASLSRTKDRLAERLGMLALYREVNLKGADLVLRLGEFNAKVEEICNDLESYAAPEVRG